MSVQLLHQSLSKSGVNVSENWIHQGLDFLKHEGVVSSVPQILLDKLFALYLECNVFETLDPNITSKIPNDIKNQHKIYFSPNQPILLQIIEVIDVSTPINPIDTDEAEMVQQLVQAVV